MALTLLRHTTPAIMPGTCYGMTDLALADTFAEEARKVLEGLPRVDRIVSSPLRRCRLLADMVANAHKQDVVEDHRVLEMDFGTWEGRLWTQIPRTEIDAWAADFMQARPHGGESVSMLRARTHAALDDYRRQPGHTLIVTHAGVIKAALAAEETAASHSATIAFGGFVTLID
ncbi:MAG: alpha-ribazole phosphatase family protein [Pseudomonadota bacterium]|nr:alpha-ribazole phosphatase family protein [Pseudomonadota bacterium]